MIRDATVSVRAIRPVLACLHALGGAIDSLLAEVGVAAETLVDPDGRIAHHAAITIWQRAVEQTGDHDGFGLHVAESTDLTQFEIIHYIYANSATVGEGVDRMVRYFRLSHDAAGLEQIPARSPQGVERSERGDLAVMDNRGLTLIRHVLPGGMVAPRHVAEWVVANMLLAARHSSGRADLMPVAVHFCHPAPRDSSEHERILGAPIRFGMADNGLLVDRRFLDTPHERADAGLLSLLERHAGELLARIGSVDTFGDRVRTLIVGELDGGNPSAENLADKLGMSVRTMSRRLRAEDTSHKALLDEVRAGLAERYLADDDLAVSDVAFLLGFSEPSAFHRAFKRWFGVSPSRKREEKPQSAR